MRAIVVQEDSPGHPLRWQEVPDPEVGPDEVLVDVHAAGVNRADLLQRAGHYPPPPGAPPYLGLEVAGIVAGVGAQVGGWNSGDRVCALLAGGGYAEQAAVPQALLMRLADTWTFASAAAIPEAFLTAYVNLFMEARLQRGETVLIHGGGSGVGTAAVQLAAQAGCRVVVTAGTQAKIERCCQLGAEFGVDYRDGDFAPPIRQRTGGVDVVLDIAGASHLAANLGVLNPCGRLVFLSLLGGARAPIDLSTVLRRRLRLIGSLLRSRPVAEKAEIVREFRKHFGSHLEDGRIAPVIHAVLPIERAEEAHAILEQHRNIGKVVLSVHP
ncbi:MAG: NAD(P)H-quinone oxidoreductase [Candidatus Latescibacterota bacterium]